MLANQIIQNYMAGMFSKHPAMKQFSQMLAGKNKEQQIETILNFARSNGIDPNAKIFSEQDVRSLGLK